MNNKGLYVAIGILAVVVLLVGGLILNKQAIVVNPSLSGSGQLETNQKWFGGGAMIGGGVKTVARGGGGNTTTTLTANDICDNFQLNDTATGIVTVTLPTGSTLQQTCLKNGASHFYKDIIYRNLGVATATVTFTAGASSSLFTASSSATLILQGGGSETLRFVSIPDGTANKVEILRYENFK